MNDCQHEDMITYGSYVYKDATVQVTLVTCDSCKAQGAQYETYDDDAGDYTFISEAWHEHNASQERR